MMLRYLVLSDLGYGGEDEISVEVCDSIVTAKTEAEVIWRAR